jgi:hypothetical protein
MTISFTSGQLNDVLKSLTVLDLNGGRITGVGYGSSAPVDRQLGDLPLEHGVFRDSPHDPVSGRQPELFLPDCVPCGYSPDMSMVKHGYLLPTTDPVKSED